LNRGRIEAKTLAEVLAIDFRILLTSAFPEAAPHADRLSPDIGIVARMLEGGRIILDSLGEAGIERCAQHPSDTVRGWGAFALGLLPQSSMADRLARVRPWADDANPGVREWAWLAVRSTIADDVRKAIPLLAGWVKDPSERIRRFASEATRPRGVWCPHLDLLKQSPKLGLPILRPMRRDPAKYVQDSVSNWLNDASKSQPDWVRDLCEQWLAGEPSPATVRICRRAMRSLK
jgi:3-methyladenine DNA glycosylase AlkC